MNLENGKNQKVLSGDLDSATPVSRDLASKIHDAVHKNGSAVETNGDEKTLEQNQERPVAMEGSQG